jgi:hypothetical protein
MDALAQARSCPLHVLAFILGVIFCSAVYLDAFQTIILPRRPAGRLRITSLFYIATWEPWSAVARRISNKGAREQFYSIYGPLSLLLLLVVWALVLVTGFALIYTGLGSPFRDPMGGNLLASFETDLYVSGTTLFTLGLGDVVPLSKLARAVVVMESGTGLGFVALVIGYVPVLYQAFSRREVDIALLDARAGSPPTAAELLRRHHFDGGDEALIVLLAAWERWSAEILETHISYPILCYYRSQHDNQSWLSAMIAVLDACALLVAVVEGPASRQAQLTFAMARHALIDVGHVFHQEKRAKHLLETGTQDRLGLEGFNQLCESLGDVGIRFCGDESSTVRLHAMRRLYEPHAQAISEYLGMDLPGWVAAPNAKDQWVVINRLREQAEAVLTRDRLAARSVVKKRELVEALVDEPHEH